MDNLDNKKVAFNLHHSKSTPSMLLRNAQNFCQKQTHQPRLLSSSTILQNHSSSISKNSLYVGSPSYNTSNKEESSSSIDSLYLVFADQVRNCLMWPFHNTGWWWLSLIVVHICTTYYCTLGCQSFKCFFDGWQILTKSWLKRSKWLGP